jgi:hypothetical protein
MTEPIEEMTNSSNTSQATPTKEKPVGALAYALTCLSPDAKEFKYSGEISKL